jgi:hypothetical protein
VCDDTLQDSGGCEARTAAHQVDHGGVVAGESTDHLAPHLHGACGAVLKPLSRKPLLNRGDGDYL